MKTTLEGPPDDSPGRSAQVQSDMRKRWVILLPAVFVTYSLAYVDRANFGFGAAAGLAETLHISSSRSALLASLFFFGYFLFQIPGVAFAKRHSTRGLIFFALIAWGIFAALTGVIRNFWLLALDRTLVGVAESFVFPSLLILLTNWFTRSERSRTNTILLLGNPITVLWMSAVTGYLIRSFGWQMTFILEGLPAVLWAFAWLYIVRDRPQDVSWISTTASTQLNEQLEREQLLLPQVPNFRSTLRNPNVILLCVQYFCWSLGFYGFVLWLPSIIQKGVTNGIEIIGLLSAAPYLLAIILMLIVAYYSDRSFRRRRFVWPFLLVSGIALFGSFFTVSNTFWWTYGFLIVAGSCMYAPYGPFFAIMPEMLPKNVSGQVTALINSFGALGGFVGTYFVGLLQAYTGSSRASFLLMAVSVTLSGIIILCLRGPSNNTLATLPDPIEPN
jgi:sugar phosphate permease